MNRPKDIIIIPEAIKRSCRAHTASEGSVLVYLIVVILIFGILGATMVSLFTTATTSSATPNDARRAYNMAESGMRYAFSQLRNTNFNSNEINTLNSTTYTVNQAGSFTVNVFSPWFYQSAIAGTLDAQVGNIPDPIDYSVSPNTWIVNLNYNPDFPISGESAVILNIVSQTTATLVLDLSHDLVARPDEKVCFAVRPSNTETYPISIYQGNTLYVGPEAQSIFPERSGAIIINRQSFAYEERDDQSGRVGLTNLSALSNGAFPINIADVSTYIVLSPGNYTVMPEGRSGDVTHGGELSFSENIYGYDQNFNPDDYHFKWKFNPDSDPEGDTKGIGAEDFIVPNPVDETINIGGGVEDSFGGAWYSGNLSLGGNPNFCNTGTCLFRLGVRVFFTLDYSGNGDGFTFTMMNADSTDGNDITSIGGDPQGSELLAYAGDSRLDAAGTTFLDGNRGRGIVPPKLAVEFDAKTNFDQNFENEYNKNYCSGSNLRQNTRNDPKPGGADRDSVQLIYWGNRAPLNIPCRPGGNRASYDDNRHTGSGGQPWTFTNPSGIVVSSPAIDPDDGTIYVGSIDGHLYAIKPDGTQKWRFPSTGSIGAVESSPTIGADGTIYVGSNDGHLYALNVNGIPKWQYPSFGSVGDIRSSPAIDRTGGAHDGTIYVGSGDPGVSGDGKLLAINPDGSLRWQFAPINSADMDVDSSPVLDSAGKIYFGADDNTVYALDPADRLAGSPFPSANEWSFSTVHDVESKPAISESKATVYVESESFVLYALNIANGAQRWAFDIDRFGIVNDDDLLESSPAIGADGTIYVGSKDGRLYAINHDDRAAGSSFPTAKEWTFNTGDAVRSSPAIDFDRTIYAGSDIGRLFAVSPGGTEKWRFPPAAETAIGAVRSSPAIGFNGLTYFGSNDTNVYAVNPFLNPRNQRDLFLSANELDVSPADPNNWLEEGPWAVRLEVERSLIHNADGNYDYNLRLWMRQCAQAGCNDILGTFFQNTRIKYDYSALVDLPLAQQIELSPSDHAMFNRFLFGFTTATAPGDTQSALIAHFNLSFILPNDPVITNDPNWP